jgi:hypothetical protein
LKICKWLDRARPLAPPRVVLQLTASVLVSALGVRAAAQPSPQSLTESQARQMARQASNEARGDPTELVLALDRRVRSSTGDFDSFPLSIIRTEDLLVTVTGPYLAFRQSVIDVLRTRRSVDRATWSGTVAVAIGPRRLTAPDIGAVELTRNGQTITPARSGLRPMTFSDGAGGERVFHAGEVHFAPSAFASAADVRLTLRVTGGEPTVYTFADAELRAIR